MADDTTQNDPLLKGVTFLTAQDEVYRRNASVSRGLGWIFGWGSSAVAAFAAVAGNLIEGEKQAHVWAGFIAAALVAVNQTVKFELWAEAYFRGHILLQTALGDHALGKATASDLTSAWEQAQAGLPGRATSTK